VDPISCRPGRADDLVKDQPQIDQVPRGTGTSRAQVPESSSSSSRLPRQEIDWNDTPWQDNIFEDNEDMQALRASIVTIKPHDDGKFAYDVLFLTMFLLKCC
jgi:hypothetical protein